MSGSSGMSGAQPYKRNDMRSKHLVQGLAVVSLLAMAASAGAQGQTKPKAPVAASPASAYAKLSFGNQKVAAALYQAQNPAVASTAHGVAPAARPLTLEEIASKRRNGQLWGQIFREMKAQGLVHEKSLGQVVARYQQTSDAVPGPLATDNGAGRLHAAEAGSNGNASGAAHAVGKGGK